MLGKILLSMVAILLGFAFSTYFLSIHGQAKANFTYAAGICFILYVAAASRAELLHYYSNPIVRWMVLLIVYLNIRYLVTSVDVSAFKHAGKSLTVILFVLACSRTFGHHQLRRFLLVSIVLAAGLSASISLYLEFILDYHPLNESRLFAIGGLHNPVVSALSYGWGLIVCVAVIIDSRSRIYNLLLGILGSALFVAIVHTNAVGALVGLFASVVILAFHRIQFRPKLTLLATLASVTILAVVSVAMVYMEYSSHQVLPRGDSFRFEIWRAAIERTVNTNILIGHSPAVSGELLLSNPFQHAHSLYIATFYYSGLFGVLMLAALIFSTLRHLRDSPNSPNYTIAVTTLAFGLTTLLFDGDRLVSSMNYVWLLFWFPLGLAIEPPRD